MDYALSLGILMLISVILALSLNLITGYCGQISLGHAAFYGTGAYVAAMLTKSGVPFGLALVAAGIVAGALGVVVGTASLRVRHDFLAITTMGGRVFVLRHRPSTRLAGGRNGHLRDP